MLHVFFSPFFRFLHFSILPFVFILHFSNVPCFSFSSSFPGFSAAVRFGVAPLASGFSPPPCQPLAGLVSMIFRSTLEHDSVLGQ